MATYSCPNCNGFGVQAQIKPSENTTSNIVRDENINSNLAEWICIHCGWQGVSGELNRGFT